MLSARHKLAALKALAEACFESTRLVDLLERNANERFDLITANNKVRSARALPAQALTSTWFFTWPEASLSLPRRPTALQCCPHSDHYTHVIVTTTAGVARGVPEEEGGVGGQGGAGAAEVPPGKHGQGAC